MDIDHTPPPVLGELLVGVRPTGRLHLGHWDSVIVPGRAGATVLVADLHAPESDDAHGYERILTDFGCHSTRIQSSWFDPQTYFRLLDLVTANELRHLTQFAHSGQPQTAHLLCYPVLQACDIMGYSAVGVGEDQAQHLDYARDWIARYNRVYVTDYPIPEARIIGGRVMDLRDPTRKMSKSHPEGCLFLDDDAETITKKIKKAKMDDDGAANMIRLFRRFVSKDLTPITNERMKEVVAREIVRTLTNPQEAEQ